MALGSGVGTGNALRDGWGYDPAVRRANVSENAARHGLQLGIPDTSLLIGGSAQRKVKLHSKVPMAPINSVPVHLVDKLSMGSKLPAHVKSLPSKQDSGKVKERRQDESIVRYEELADNVTATLQVFLVFCKNVCPCMSIVRSHP